MRTWSWILGFLGGMGLLAFVAYAAFVDQIQTPAAIAGAAAACLVAAWVWLDWAALRHAAQARGTRFSLTATMLVVVVAGIAVALNILAHRYDQRLDLTASQRFALSEQTKKVLAGIDQDVDIVAYFPAGSDEETRFKDLSAGYTEANDHITVTMHDPVREPMAAQQDKITSSYGTVIVKVGDSTQRLDQEFTEEALTNALIRATSGKKHVVCYVTGHGELDSQDDSSATGLGLVTTKLTSQNYDVHRVSLVREGGVPEDCEVVVVADPQTDWLAPEQEDLAAYVAGGGKAIVMLDPTHAPGLASDLARYGIDVGNDIVLESNPKYQMVGGDATYLVLDADSFTKHPLTEAAKGMVILRMARSVGAGNPIKGIKDTVLAHSTPNGWGETTLDSTTPPQPDNGDIVGNVPLMTLAEIDDPKAIDVGSRAMGGGVGASNTPTMAPTVAPTSAPTASGPAAAGADPPTAADPSPDAQADATAPTANGDAVVRQAGGKILVIGDSDFASNDLVGQGSNQDLFLNAIAWMVGEEDQVSIRPNPASTASLSMNVLQGIGVWLACLLLVPGTAIGMAIGTWRKRRML